jgi:23S rRNA (adenine-N6)-dimethyltransferase
MNKRSIPVRFTGQHFTIDSALIHDAIRLAEIKKEDLVLDIGAGRGFLTVHLIRHTDQVIAIENDPRLVAGLKSGFRSTRNLTIVGVDFRSYSVPRRGFKVVSNIPYGITTEILKKLMYTNVEFFSGGCLVMQLEPAQKLTRKKFFNPYPVFYRTFYDLELVYEISPGSFMPPPTVKSALLKIRKKQGPVIGVEMKEKYLDFLFCMLKYPGLPVRTALRKIFRKQQLRKFPGKYCLNLDGAVSDLSPQQWAVSVK